MDIRLWFSNRKSLNGGKELGENQIGRIHVIVRHTGKHLGLMIMTPVCFLFAQSKAPNISRDLTMTLTLTLAFALDVKAR